MKNCTTLGFIKPGGVISESIAALEDAALGVCPIVAPLLVWESTIHEQGMIMDMLRITARSSVQQEDVADGF